MPSFEMIYEDEEDVLEVTFELFEESFARAISLNDNIQLHTDLGCRVAWGITLYSYAQLLQVGETYLDGLTTLTPGDRERIVALLSRQPASHFLEVMDPEALLARIKAPALQALIET